MSMGDPVLKTMKDKFKNERKYNENDDQPFRQGRRDLTFGHDREEKEGFCWLECF